MAFEQKTPSKCVVGSLATALAPKKVFDAGHVAARMLVTTRGCKQVAPVYPTLSQLRSSDERIIISYKKLPFNR